MQNLVESSALPDVEDIYDAGVREARANLVTALSKLNDDDPRRIDLLFKIAAFDYADDNYTSAISRLEDIQAKESSLSLPQKIAVHRFLGLTYLAASRKAEAAANYRQALALAKDSPSDRLKILRGLNEVLEDFDPSAERLQLLREQAELAAGLDDYLDAGWSYLLQSDAEKQLGKREESTRSFDRAIVAFTRYFGSKQASSPTVPTDLWEALDAGPQRPPGGYWRAAEMPPRAVVVCIHGLGLHSGYYEALGKALSARNISVVAMDVRGFGEWADTRLNTNVEINDAVDDAVALVHAIRKLNPGVPIFLLGESMGGAIALRAALTADVAGVISSVPAADRYNAMATKMRVAWHVILAGNSDYNVKRDVVDKVSRNEAVREAWETDRLAKLKFAPTQLINFQRFMKHNVEQAKLLKLPVLITQGDRDELVKADSTIKLFRAIGSEQKDLLLIGPAEHLIFEAGQFSPLLLDGIVSWMSAIAKQTPTTQTPSSSMTPQALPK